MNIPVDEQGIDECRNFTFRMTNSILCKQGSRKNENQEKKAIP
jgi:hypothetical protein